MVLLARCYLLKLDWEMALKSADTALNFNKDDVKAMIVKGEALFNVCQFEHSLVFFNRARVRIHFLVVRNRETVFKVFEPLRNYYLLLKSSRNKKDLNYVTAARFWVFFLSCQQQKNTKKRAAVKSSRSFLFCSDFSNNSYSFPSFNVLYTFS